MELVILGSAGWIPLDRRMTTCLALRTDDDLVLFDAGTGIARLHETAWQRLLPAPDREIHVFLSHLHFDHVIGLTFLPALWKNPTVVHVPMTENGVPDVGAAGSGAGAPEAGMPGPGVLDQMFGGAFFPTPFDRLLPSISREPIGPGEQEVVGLRIVARLQEHPGGSLGYRVDDLLAFMTDTRDEPGAVEFARSVKVLVHEAWTTEDDDPGAARTSASGHTSAEQAAELARRAGVEELLLSHLPPTEESHHDRLLQRARAIFPRTDLCRDGLVRRLAD